MKQTGVEVQVRRQYLQSGGSLALHFEAAALLLHAHEGLDGGGGNLLLPQLTPHQCTSCKAAHIMLQAVRPGACNEITYQGNNVASK